MKRATDWQRFRERIFVGVLVSHLTRCATPAQCFHLTVAIVRKVQAEAIAVFGGSDGVRDRHHLHRFFLVTAPGHCQRFVRSLRGSSTLSAGAAPVA